MIYVYLTQPIANCHTRPLPANRHTHTLYLITVTLQDLSNWSALLEWILQPCKVMVETMGLIKEYQIGGTDLKLTSSASETSIRLSKLAIVGLAYITTPSHPTHHPPTLHHILPGSIYSQNTKCDNSINFPKSGHI